MTQRDRYTVVLAEQIEREVQTALAAKIAPLSTVEAQEIAASMVGWFNRVRLERWPGPSRDYVKRHESILLPALRHVNDLPAAAAALQARPDWVISSNRVHWNNELGVRDGSANSITAGVRRAPISIVRRPLVAK